MRWKAQCYGDKTLSCLRECDIIVRWQTLPVLPLLLLLLDSTHTPFVRFFAHFLKSNLHFLNNACNYRDGTCTCISVTLPRTSHVICRLWFVHYVLASSCTWTVSSHIVCSRSRSVHDVDDNSTNVNSNKFTGSTIWLSPSVYAIRTFANSNNICRWMHDVLDAQYTVTMITFNGITFLH